MTPALHLFFSCISVINSLKFFKVYKFYRTMLSSIIRSHAHIMFHDALF